MPSAFSLADKISSDARQVSRYETGRITPSLEGLIKIAEIFNTSVDYLVITDAPRRPLHSPENAISAQLADITELEPDDQAALLKVLDALVTKTRLRALTNNIS